MLSWACPLPPPSGHTVKLGCGPPKKMGRRIITKCSRQKLLGQTLSFWPQPWYIMFWCAFVLILWITQNRMNFPLLMKRIDVMSSKGVKQCQCKTNTHTHTLQELWARYAWLATASSRNKCVEWEAEPMKTRHTCERHMSKYDTSLSENTLSMPNTAGGRHPGLICLLTPLHLWAYTCSCPPCLEKGGPVNVKYNTHHHAWLIHIWSRWRCDKP